MPTEKPTIVPNTGTPIQVSDKDPEIDRDTELEDLRRENKEIKQQIKILESKLTGSIKIRLDLAITKYRKKYVSDECKRY